MGVGERRAVGVGRRAGVGELGEGKAGSGEGVALGLRGRAAFGSGVIGLRSGRCQGRLPPTPPAEWDQSPLQPP